MIPIFSILWYISNTLYIIRHAERPLFEYSDTCKRRDFMINIGLALFSAALRVVENLVTEWTRKKEVVHYSDIDRQIAHLAKAEADRLRLRVSDLEMETKRVWSILLSRMQEEGYTGFSAEANALFMPAEQAEHLEMAAIRKEYQPDSLSAQMLKDLQQRVSERESSRA